MTYDTNTHRGDAGKRALPASRPGARQPVFDFGLTVVLYLFALVTLSTILLAVGVTIGPYHCLLALPATWGILLWYKKAPFYTLALILVAGAFLAACSVAAFYMADMAWDSNNYHKVDIGLLANGWNPFTSTLIDFTNTHDLLPYNAHWLTHQLDMWPKATFIISACFYAATGFIEMGKVFNLAAAVAVICLMAPMLKELLRMRWYWAALTAILTAVNAVSLSQMFLYYNDGFLFQLLTINALGLAYLHLSPKGKYEAGAKFAVFAAVCLAIGVKTSALLYCGLLCLLYYLPAVIKTANSGLKKREKKTRQTRLFLYFLCMVLCAILLTGAATYVTNVIHFGNPLAGVIGDDFFTRDFSNFMSPQIAEYPEIAKFFISMFSHASNGVFDTVSLKMPFSYTQSDWTTVGYDTLLGGWGVLFSGIFIVSVLIILITAVRLFQRKKPRFGRFVLLVLALVILLPAIIPFLWAVRYYPLPYWLSFLALSSLFAGSQLKRNKIRTVNMLLGMVLSGLLLFNLAPYSEDLRNQYAVTAETRETLQQMLEQQDQYTYDIHTEMRGKFYGTLFDLRDEGLSYNFTDGRQGINDYLFTFLSYYAREKGEAAEEETLSFLNRLFDNGFITVLAGGPGWAEGLGEEILRTMQALGLTVSAEGAANSGYLAVLNTAGNVVYQQTSGETVEYSAVVDGVAVYARSSVAPDGTASIVINGVELAADEPGLHAAVFDPAFMHTVEARTIAP